MTKNQREKLDGFYSRKLRRAIAKEEGQPFIPEYNGKDPITFEEYLANFKKDENGKSLAPRKLQKSPLLDKPKKKAKKKKATAKPKKATTVKASDKPKKTTTTKKAADKKVATTKKATKTKKAEAK